MINVTAEQNVKPGREFEVDILMQNLTQEIMENEPGCVCFDYLIDVENPQRRLVYETYRDEEAFIFHCSTKYLKEFIPKLIDCLVEPPKVIRYQNVFENDAPQSFFHTGIVVPNLEEAVSYYSSSLGMKFTEPGIFKIPRLEDPEPHFFELTAVMSRTEPPFLELIQASGSGIISSAQCGKILYHAFWETDMDTRLADIVKNGPGADAVFRMEEGSTPFAIITSEDAYGNRIEYVGTDGADQLIEWIRTGRLPQGIGA
jgi:quinol monooxygenase YgiN/catechol 2,3-dioxygenase-like lactoylglutathione lyase family enzyme